LPNDEYLKGPALKKELSVNEEVKTFGAQSRTKQILNGKTVLITGTTGFVGKALLEKVIRVIPDVGELILLIRGNQKHPSAMERFWEEIYQSSIFDHLKSHNETDLARFCDSKVRCITGEITEPCFGVSESEYQYLLDHVDAVINSAASVNFREEIDQALKINTLSLNHMVEFIKASNNAKLVHVSTCYVNGFNKGLMEESIVQPRGLAVPKAPEGHYLVEGLIADCIEEANGVCEKIIDEKVRKAELVDLGTRLANNYGWNDTYTFTKWMGEQLLLQKLPITSMVILRPSIIESTYFGPTRGWVEGVKVADALVLAYARRRFSFFPARSKGVIDIIPVDIVANSIILSAAWVFDHEGEQQIVQCCSSTRNPLSMAKYIRLVTDEVRVNWQKYPKLTKGKPPRKKMTAVGKNVFLTTMKSIRSALQAQSKLPFVQGKSEKNLESIEIALKLSTIYSFYSNPHYVFGSDHLLDLADQMGEKDKELFPVDPADINWDEYFSKVHIAGLEKYGLR
jgi:fatty acyl-CoA reductase